MARIVTGFLSILPFIYLPGFGSYTAFRFFAFGGIALILGILTIRIWLTERWILRAIGKKLLVYLFLLYSIAFLFVSMTGIDPAFSLFSSFVRTDGIFTQLFLYIFSLSIATIILYNGERSIHSLLKASVISAAIFSLLMIASPDGIGLLRGEFWERSRGGATIGNSSLAALYVAWNIFFALFLAKHTANWKGRLGWVVALGVMIMSPIYINGRVLWGGESAKGVVDLLGFARGGILGVAVGLLVSAIVWLATDTKKVYTYVGRALLVMILSGICVTGGALLNKGSAIHEAFNQVVGSSRFIFWDSAWAGFLERPWLGWGPNTFSEVYHRNFNPDILLPGNTGEVLVDKPHNIFFETLVAGGVILTLALIAYLAAIIYLFVDLLKRRRFLGVVSLGAFTAWFIQVQFVFDSVASLVLLFLLLGISMAMAEKPDQYSTLPSRLPLTLSGKRILIFSIILASIVFFFVIYLPMKKVRLMYQFYDMQLPARANMWMKMSNISPMGDRYDSALIFSAVYDAYLRRVVDIRRGDPLLKAAALEELDAMGVYLDSLLESGGATYELIMVNAQIRYVRLLIESRDVPQVWDTVLVLTNRAHEISPTDPRPIKLLEILQSARK